MENWNSWLSKLGEIKPYQRMGQTLPSFGNIERYNQNQGADFLNSMIKFTGSLGDMTKKQEDSEKRGVSELGRRVGGLVGRGLTTGLFGDEEPPKLAGYKKSFGSKFKSALGGILGLGRK